MTSVAASTYRGTISSTAEAAKTAPVHEYRCLYTHDLRRKQKRWQDGYLKFHTFNKRVMVYDQQRNYIGDTHWKDGDTPCEGDELALDNGVLVEVAEPVATTQTDLTPIFQKKPREATDDAVPAHVPAVPRLPTPAARSSSLRPQSQPRHRPLAALLGTPRGPHGRAMLPPKSPYEEKHAKADQENEWASERAAKRQKVVEAGHVRNAVITATTPRPKKQADQIDGQTPGARGAAAYITPLAQKVAKRTPKTRESRELIDITSDNDELQSDVTVPDTPPGFIKLAPIQRRVTRKLPPKAPELTPRLSPPVSTTNKVVDVQKETELLEKAVEDAEEQADRALEPPKKILKLTSGTRRKMLLCQNGLPAKRHVKTSSIDDGRSGDIVWGSSHPIDPPKKGLPNPQKPTRTSDIRRLQNGLTQSSSLPEDPSREPTVEDGNPDGGIGQEQLAHIDKRTAVKPKFVKSIDSRLAALVKPNTVLEKGTAPRQFRRVRSENDRPVDNEESIPVSNDDQIEELPPRPLAPERPGRQVAMRSKETAPKRALHRSESLAVTTAIQYPQKARDSTPPSPIVDTDVGPWSSEAFDLFDWRPPGFVWLGQGKGFGHAETDNAKEGETGC